MIAVASAAMPFAYFYTEATYIEDEDIPRHKKIATAVKYSAALVIIVVILLLVGLFLHTDHIKDLLISSDDDQTTPSDASPVARRLFQVANESSSSAALSQLSDGTSDLVNESTDEEQNGPVVAEDSLAIAYNYLEQILDSNCTYRGVQISKDLLALPPHQGTMG